MARTIINVHLNVCQPSIKDETIHSLVWLFLLRLDPAFLLLHDLTPSLCNFTLLNCFLEHPNFCPFMNVQVGIKFWTDPVAKWYRWYPSTTEYDKCDQKNRCKYWCYTINYMHCGWPSHCWQLCPPAPPHPHPHLRLLNGESDLRLNGGTLPSICYRIISAIYIISARVYEFHFILWCIPCFQRIRLLRTYVNSAFICTDTWGQ